MASPVLIAKAAIAVASDERLRKGVGWILVAIFAPVIVVIALLCSLGTGAAEQNVSTVELCFNGGTIPDTVPEEYRVYIVDMQNSLSLLDGYITEINEQTEDGASLPFRLSVLINSINSPFTMLGLKVYTVLYWNLWRSKT